MNDAGSPSPKSAASPDAPTALVAASPEAPLAIAATRAWVERAVIGLNLCPFARAAEQRGRVRYVHSAATDAEALLADFCDELRRLVATSPSDTETTLLVHPRVLADFDDYNDFLDVADAALEALGCAGTVQVASFHPQYRFAGVPADDVSNATNRSPWPILQLLREESVAAAALAFPEGASIYEANIGTLRSLGPDGWSTLQAACLEDAALAVRATEPNASAGASIHPPSVPTRPSRRRPDQ